MVRLANRSTGEDVTTTLEANEVFRVLTSEVGVLSFLRKHELPAATHPNPNIAEGLSKVAVALLCPSASVRPDGSHQTGTISALKRATKSSISSTAHCS